MCGRFSLFASGELISQQFGVSVDHDLEPRYNIAPTQPVAAVRQTADGQGREFTYLQWGLIPSWAKDPKIGSRMINARSETVTEKPSFRAAFKRRRCLIPASGFYEWQKTANGKQPMFIRPAGDELFGLAGLWEYWESADGSTIHSCTILTTEPNELMAAIHNRMPVIIEAEDYSMWLDPGPDPTDAQHLLRPYTAQKMVAYPVSTAVNNPRNENPQCVQPI
ncbi:MAG: SOS response-associated peptidase [Candidatus Promineifilaceae bacterium]|nr:SOS response-associated peptidase [Candidatus Promineifilaceae bacterium]